MGFSCEYYSVLFSTSSSYGTVVMSEQSSVCTLAIFLEYEYVLLVQYGTYSQYYITKLSLLYCSAKYLRTQCEH